MWSILIGKKHYKKKKTKVARKALDILDNLVMNLEILHVCSNTNKKCFFTWEEGSLKNNEPPEDSIKKKKKKPT